MQPIGWGHKRTNFIAANVLTISATGTTPGRRNVSNEKCPDARAANNNPRVTEKVQLIVPASNAFFQMLMALRVGSPDGGRTRNLHLERVTS
jgi:hypothetical protein